MLLQCLQVLVIELVIDIWSPLYVALHAMWHWQSGVGLFGV